MLSRIFLLPCLPFLFFGTVVTFAAWLARSHTLITLTNRRLIINKGIFSKTTVELMLKQIQKRWQSDCLYWVGYSVTERSLYAAPAVEFSFCNS